MSSRSVDGAGRAAVPTAAGVTQWTGGGAGGISSGRAGEARPLSWWRDSSRVTSVAVAVSRRCGAVGVVAGAKRSWRSCSAALASARRRRARRVRRVRARRSAVSYSGVAWSARWAVPRRRPAGSQISVSWVWWGMTRSLTARLACPAIQAAR